MSALLTALLFFAVGAIGALLFANRGRWPTILGAGGTLVGCLCGAAPAASVALGGAARSLRIPWDVPYGSFFLRLDRLSGFFLLPIFLLCAMAAIYGADYLKAHRGRNSVAAQWFFFNVLVASMVVVVLAGNGVLFLMAWEMMALSSFFLVTFEHEKEEVRQAGWTYLIASHLGTAFLLALFILLGRASGSLDFDRFNAASGAGLLFVLALVGFGTKAGFVPFHVWLPQAHPAAPSHVSALMSAVMIKTGIYGLVRMLTLLGAPEPWWGWLLCAVGVTSGIFGVLLALAQHDLKRLLAYSSVENVGIIALGLGVGLVGLSAGMPGVAVAGFAGALLHVINHALFKGLLFFAAGNVAHGAHTREIDHLGGLLRRMPSSGAAFLVGAAAISGLPPLNGFVSEFLIYAGSFTGALSLAGGNSVALLIVIAGLALIGGLAAACFAKAFGIVFLGHPRTHQAAEAHEAGAAMLVPGFALAAGCILIGFFGSGVLQSMSAVLASVTGLPSDVVRTSLAGNGRSLALVSYMGAGLVAVVLLLTVIRARALAVRSVRTSVTWDCGYAQPTSRMQYTASSFAQPMTEIFGSLLKPRRVLTAPRGLFPKEAHFSMRIADPCERNLYQPVFAGIGQGLSWLRPLQQGKVQFYILYIALTLLILLIWQFA